MPIALVLPHCEALDARRRALGWTIGQLAQKSGYAANTILRCLHGKNVRLDTFLIVATTLGFTVDVRLPPKAA